MPLAKFTLEQLKDCFTSVPQPSWSEIHRSTIKRLPSGRVAFRLLRKRGKGPTFSRLLQQHIDKIAFEKMKLKHVKVSVPLQISHECILGPILQVSA